MTAFRKFALAACFAALSATTALAATTSASLTSNPSQGSNFPTITGASYTGTMSYDDGSGLLTLGLSNTSAAALGGFLTAFVFNLPTGLSYVASSFTQTTVSGTPDAFTVAVGSQSASPYGTFNTLTSEGGSFEGGGSPGGLAPGEAATFTYSLSALLGFALTDFSISSFLAATSTDGSKDPAFFVARFRGFANGGSDKLPAIGRNLQPPPVPVPAALPLLASGLGALGVMGWFRRRKASAEAA